METKLTPQQLSYIDRYLKNSDVFYDDIRYEMTDHVASAIENMEGNFYDNLYSYMAEHRTELLESNKVFKKLAFDKAVSLITKTLANVQLYSVTAILFATAYFAGTIAGNETITDNLHIALILILTVVLLNFWYYKIFSSRSYSVIDKLLTVVYFGAIVIRVDMFIENTILLNLYYSFCIAFFILLTQSLYRLKRKYKLRYEV